MKYYLLIILSLFITSCGNLKGDRGVTGHIGPPGNTGETGPAGERGTPGKDAPKVIPIQFCQGQVTQYPTVFPEFGLVINNEIFAVFTSNGQNYLAKIVPGTYSSNATGLSCSFTVLSTGAIQ